MSPSLDLENYDELWNHLKNIPVLRGKVFPEKCSTETWKCALGTFSRDHYAVNMSGSLRFNTAPGCSPFFRLQLAPLTLQFGHRFGRRFGNDRFLELDMPHLSSHGKTPKLLQDLGDQGRDIILEWLIVTKHQMCGRLWCPFHVKPKDGKKRKIEVTEVLSDESNAATAHRVFLFASDGLNFTQNTKIPPANESMGSHTTMSVSSLLNWLRPLRKNTEQPFLKLFSRTSLALARMYPTVVLPRQSIRRRKDIMNGDECMTDGAGRMSPALARNITQTLGLTYVPSGFQGRIGEAKGFWSVDIEDRSGVEWIDVYDSQAKWIPGDKPASRSNDPCHRTFEVLNQSGPLRSADLNLQLLPILVDRALSKERMITSISQILQNGIEKEMNEQRAAMQDPLLFQKWLHERYSSLKERVDAKVLQYKAALPEKSEDQIKLLLNSGFSPMQLPFLKDLAWEKYRAYCNTLKTKMNITVGKSAYIYMVPDFSGSLAPNEVFVDFSTFKYDTDYQTSLLKDTNVLVARSPAHYISDVQKVTAVYKAELIGLKDVIVFSTQGNPSLASKLSGGDYDGDLAWVCWEPSIVDNFVNADVPQFPDLLKDGILSQNKVKYDVLTEGLGSQPGVNKFLKAAFDFNMQQSMLGICTNYKDEVCYKLGNINSEQAILLSTLLSKLVDQAKQGYSLTDESWSCLKKKVNVIPSVPAYKQGILDDRSDHIVDKLFVVAHSKIENALKELHISLGNPPEIDADLTRFYNTARQQAQTEPEWKLLLDDLVKDIQEVMNTWCDRWSKNDDKRGQQLFNRITAECYGLFQNISPKSDTQLTRVLLARWLPFSDMSPWALLRASATFKLRRHGRFCWLMAGKQLARLKAESRSGSYVAIVPKMYAALKPDATFIKLTRNGNMDGAILEARVEGEWDCDDGELEDW
ncbi:hypothetical protein BP6252_11467 [Coleophoma cylindrospora]|uniref:RNA-dependent RNA polymerase n=1 Tax=Coleophoma cylindrospora TaxID=1849047 RepID=A0A3D8QKR7_9HELO|nr:hypothetical protein BP6252_11467 [Coleophoma cylindrospora]